MVEALPHFAVSYLAEFWISSLILLTFSPSSFVTTFSESSHSVLSRQYFQFLQVSATHLSTHQIFSYSSRGVWWSQGPDVSPAANGAAHRARPHQGQRCSRGLPQLDPEERRAPAQRSHGYFNPSEQKQLRVFCCARHVLIICSL